MLAPLPKQYYKKVNAKKALTFFMADANQFMLIDDANKIH